MGPGFSGIVTAGNISQTYKWELSNIALCKSGGYFDKDRSITRRSFTNDIGFTAGLKVDVDIGSEQTMVESFNEMDLSLSPKKGMDMG
ncbi:hypothetical protein V6N13_037743 [Hibiscus sabdariffa]|uniref:Uncharacterized protein n=1 Tax=Hibiscus sabdariffa TaxID=183260 RepID=A0ABR2S501_9ROSI